jgi:hypothetical protein
MYEQDYIVYKDKQEVKLCCMKCGKTLKERTTKTLYEKIDSKTYNPMIVTNYDQLEQYARVTVPIKMGNGAKGEAGAFLCLPCSKEPIDAAALINQIRRGWELEMRAHNKSEEEIKEYFDTVGNISQHIDIHIV